MNIKLDINKSEILFSRGFNSFDDVEYTYRWNLGSTTIPNVYIEMRNGDKSSFDESLNSLILFIKEHNLYGIKIISNTLSEEEMGIVINKTNELTI